MQVLYAEGMEPIGSVRVRLYLGGQLVRQETVEITSGADLAKLGEVHSTYLLNRAAREGGLWMVEVEILNDPTDPDRFLRFGTDDGGMREPHPLFG